MNENVTIQQAARDALLVQDACNLSGVVRAMARASEALWASPECTGTDWVNGHPIMRLFAEQVWHLTGAGAGYSKAQDECVALAGMVGT